MNSSQENELGRDYASQIDNQAKFVMDGKINRRVLDIATPIFAQAQKDRPDVSFRIRVIDSPELNAFSIPGGYVYIYRGLLDKIGKDDDALACVIGHESAHVVRRHVVKSISDSENKGLSGGPRDRPQPQQRRQPGRRGAVRAGPAPLQPHRRV